MFATLHHWFLVFLVETCVWFVFCFLILYISVYSPVHKWMNIQRKQCEIKIENTKEGRRSHRKRTIDRARADTQFRFWSKFSVTIFFRFSVLDSFLFYKKVEYCLNISFKNILCGWTTKKSEKWTFFSELYFAAAGCVYSRLWLLSSEMREQIEVLWVCLLVSCYFRSEAPQRKGCGR